MNKIMDVIADRTGGISYKSHRYCYDGMQRSGIDYDISHEPDRWDANGETVNDKNRNFSLKDLAYQIAKEDDSIFKYFLDGSRHTYKIDDISYNNKVYPVIGGQIGIGCCSRSDHELHKEYFKRLLVIALPECASEDEWHREEFFETVVKDINSITRLEKMGISFDEVLYYRTDIKESQTYEDKGIAKIQDKMIELEKNAVSNLVAKGKLNERSVLIKDGSIEYQKMGGNNENDLSNKKFRANYQNVIGVSKSFNPAKCYSSEGKLDSNRIAKLEPFERTPVNMYYSQRAGNVWFGVWYVRIRDKKYSNNVFDGILKVEKILDSDDDDRGVPLDTDLVDTITANLLNERNPVCYGDDLRWANHIYPIYLTESFVKSQYLSSELFLELF